MPRFLADGRTKLAVLTQAPVNPAAPKLAELNAGIDASCVVLASDFTLGATDSDKVGEKALCQENNAQALGSGNFAAAFTIWRYWNADGSPDEEADELFEAVKVKGSTLWLYARRTAKKSVAPWAADDEIFLGVETVTDTPQSPGDQGGYIKYRVPTEVQNGYPFISAVAS